MRTDFILLTQTDAAATASKEVEKKVNTLVTVLDKYKTSAIEFGISLLIAIVILVIGRMLIKLIMKMITKMINRTRWDLEVKRFIASATKAVLYVFLILILLEVIGVKNTSLVALFGSAGVAIGLAMQGALSNLASGVLIMIVRPFRVGDMISEEGKEGLTGTVDRIDLFYTRLTTLDNQVIVVPNGSLINSRIINITTSDHRQILFRVGVGYEADLKKVKALLRNVLDEVDCAVEGKPKDVLVKELGSSSVLMEARVWVPSEEYWNVLFALNERVKECFDENGISIPYDQLDVHIKKS